MGNICPLLFSGNTIGKRRASGCCARNAAITGSFSILRQQPPQRTQNVELLRGKTGNIRAAAQPLDVGMTAHHAAGGAGHIGEDALKRPAIPPLLRLRRITGQQLRGQFQTLQIFCDALQTLLVLVYGNHLDQRAFQNMRRLAARCGTGIQHAHPVMHVQQARGVLRTGILHRDQAIKKSRQLVHRHGFVQLQRINIKLAKRFVCPLARLRDNQRLGCGRLQPSRMASCFTQKEQS